MGQFIFDYWEFSHKEPFIGMLMLFGMLSFSGFIEKFLANPRPVKGDPPN